MPVLPGIAMLTFASSTFKMYTFNPLDLDSKLLSALALKPDQGVNCRK